MYAYIHMHIHVHTGKGLTSLMVSIRDVCKPVEQWQCGGVPLTMMMNMERRKGCVLCARMTGHAHRWMHACMLILPLHQNNACAYVRVCVCPSQHRHAHTHTHARTNTHTHTGR